MTADDLEATFRDAGGTEHTVVEIPNLLLAHGKEFVEGLIERDPSAMRREIEQARDLLDEMEKIVDGVE